MAKAKLMPLYEQVARLVEHEIESGRFKPGDKIYSIREVCETFDVSDVTAKKALQQLSQRGLVHSITGSGVFVSDRDKAPAPAPIRKVVGLLKVGLHPKPIYQYEIDLIQQELQQSGYPMVYTAVEPAGDLEAAVRHLVDVNAGCLVVFPQHSSAVTEETLNMLLRNTNVPVLILESRSSRDSYITVDTERGTTELMDYLYDLGHRHICLASAFKRKVAGFERAVKRWNDPEVRHCILKNGFTSEVETREVVKKIIESEPRPTVLVANSDRAAIAMIEHLLDAGLKVPEDISVATFDDHPAYAERSPVPLTVMRHPCREIAQETASWVTHQLSPDKPRRPRKWRRELTGSLIVRDSTMPVGEAAKTSSSGT